MEKATNTLSSCPILCIGQMLGQIIATTLWPQDYYLQSTDGETEALRMILSSRSRAEILKGFSPNEQVE